MDTDAAAEMLVVAKRELSDARVQVAHLEQVVDGLTGLLNAAGVDLGIESSRQETLHGSNSPHEFIANLRPRDAVLHVLSRRPGLAMTPRRIYDYLVQHDMVNTEMKSGVAAYDMALRRLAEEVDNGVERDEETGTYTLRRGVSSTSAVRNRLAHAAEVRDYGPNDVEGEDMAAMRDPQVGVRLDREKVERMTRERKRARKFAAEQEHGAAVQHRAVRSSDSSRRSNAPTQKSSKNRRDEM
ncbi:hypothetical protein [Nesterenkonia populi]|uniref:hypothetical protein n=1 Tax=Nesterenkonia populi TaxID=1591087 RepID=UPI0011BDD8CA|nr:hypothetical protein [Nesterenkonia populi]